MIELRLESSSFYSLTGDYLLSDWLKTGLPSAGQSDQKSGLWKYFYVENLQQHAQVPSLDAYKNHNLAKGIILSIWKIHTMDHWYFQNPNSFLGS